MSLYGARGENLGGNGIAFDWELLKKYDQEIPFFLGGGISPENVSGVRPLQTLNIHALDVNSGVEWSPGLKSTERLESLIANIPH